ncbi:50S ribosomal protein L28 [Natronoglycomyces albus]|uniref:Large ribosomal subunit protein bL28 n=1 Tax=Natronoglycomyces albus TaxID=2811108 RepID=A0A895XR40_9ACTN|nr:50S ribosomal protein L28 [Natronoglycomyces albus]QSB06182.1 50S ribosomal protein L28 [Natronoglycomyces albus]
MSSVCEACGKRPGFGNNVPWSKKKTRRRWNPNLQSVRISTGSGDNHRRAKVCTSCLKAGKVAR